jgi:hypothetical protein
MRPGRCVVDGKPSDGRRFCRGECYVKFPDGRERRPGKEIEGTVYATGKGTVSFYR